MTARHMASSSSSSSRHQVTITLGRSGQVVKRQPISDRGNADEMPSLGRKRSVRERLGSSMDDSDLYHSQHRNKRRQTESHSSRLGDDDLDCQVGKDDLRLKLMRKGLSQRSNGGAQTNGVDLRDKLTRSTKNSSRHDAREKVPESRSRYDARAKAPESRASGFVSRIPPARSADDLLKLDSLRKPYSSWTLDGLRRKSPDRLMSAPRAMSPPRNYDQRRPISSLRSVGTSRASSLMTRDAADVLRPASYISKSTVPVDTMQPVNRGPPSATVLPTIPLMSEGPLTVAGLLNSLGLEKYVILFQAEEVDMAALRQMGDNDLKEIGIPMGPRKKILLAVSSHSKQRPR